MTTDLPIYLRSYDDLTPADQARYDQLWEENDDALAAYHHRNAELAEYDRELSVAADYAELYATYWS